MLSGLAEHIDLLLDAGPTPGGLESTVLDVTTDPPCLLRPGLITQAQLMEVIGAVDDRRPMSPALPARAPGQMARHYAPRTPLELIAGSGRERVLALVQQGLRVGWVTVARDGTHATTGAEVIVMPDDAAGYAARLYAVLHELDGRGLDRIVLDLPPATDDWLAVHDRLRRASS